MIKTLFISMICGLSTCFCSCVTNNKNTSNENKEQVTETAKMPSIEDTYGEWELMKVGNENVTFDAAISISDMKFSTKICNQIAGDITQKERRADAMRFDNVLRTQMMGAPEEMKIEDAFAKALDEVRSFSVSGDTLSLVDAEDNVLIQAVKK